MRVSAVQAMKKLAESNFKLGKPEFHGFDGLEEIEVKKSDLLEQVDVWADLSVAYEGEPPDGYRVLNSMLSDWVDEHEADLKKLINPGLKSYLKKEYSDIDTSDLDEDFDDYIWEDQVDYMPQVNENEKKISFSLELVLDIEQEEETNATE